MRLAISFLKVEKYKLKNYNVVLNYIMNNLETIDQDIQKSFSDIVETYENIIKNKYKPPIHFEKHIFVMCRIIQRQQHEISELRNLCKTHLNVDIKDFVQKTTTDEKYNENVDSLHDLYCSITCDEEESCDKQNVKICPDEEEVETSCNQKEAEVEVKTSCDKQEAEVETSYEQKEEAEVETSCDK